MTLPPYRWLLVVALATIVNVSYDATFYSFSVLLGKGAAVADCGRAVFFVCGDRTVRNREYKVVWNSAAAMFAVAIPVILVADRGDSSGNLDQSEER